MPHYIYIRGWVRCRHVSENFPMLETSSTCTCTVAQFRCSKLPLKFLHARTCRILSVFGYRVLDTWFERKRVFGFKTHAYVQKKYMEPNVFVAPAFTNARKSERFARLSYKSIGTF